MPITYTNRKGRTYYLCQSTTKTGKSRYYFARETTGTPVEEIPAGYTIQESVNGIVSLAKARPVLLTEEEINTVRRAIQRHPKSNRYRMESRSNQITVYEHVGLDLTEMARRLATGLGIDGPLDTGIVHRLQEEERVYGQFTPVMRFILTDDARRRFKAQRMSYRGGVDEWRDVEYDKPLAELSSRLIPTLGTDQFFELF